MVAPELLATPTVHWLSEDGPLKVNVRVLVAKLTCGTSHCASEKYTTPPPVTFRAPVQLTGPPELPPASTDLQP
jgi:hypothetical protein